MSAPERVCVFCQIVDGADEPRHHVVAETGSAVAFMNANPAALGHVLVIPKAHADDVWSLPADDGIEVFDLARRVALAARETLRPDGLNLFQANGRAAWQSVFHFHVHVVPRWFGDPLVPNWTSPQGRREDIPNAAQAIAASFSKSQPGLDATREAGLP